MATLSTTNLKAAVKRAINKIKNKRADHSNEANGVFFITGSKAVVAADYDVIGDLIELCELPANSYLLGASVVSDKDYDTGSAVRHDLVVTEGTSLTTAVGSAFVLAGQPQNDTIQVFSSDAADIAPLSVTIIGTTQGTDTVVVETVALHVSNGTTAVDTVKTDWGFILAVKLSAACAGTITVQEKSGGVDCTTLAAGLTQKGVHTVTSTNYHSRLVEMVCSGTGGKMIGFKGTDVNGTAQYDSQALNGVTLVYSNLPFATVTEVYFGDLESSRTVTVKPGSLLLVSASSAFSTTPPTPINFTGSTAYGTEFGCDVSEGILALRCNVAPSTANTGTVTFTYKVAVYYGSTSSLA